MASKNIRNFSIIAHIDHGKSTLSDRLIEACGGLSAREMSSQVLDSMDLERERGITIKSQSVTLNYSFEGCIYQLNLIDTPGHVDFAYEVSRSLAACEGALLVVDATQGVEAQTVANCYTAVSMGLTVSPVLNKLDLPTADPIRVCEEIESIIGLSAQNAASCSAKTGAGIAEVLEHIVRHIPPPKGSSNSPLQALIIDSWFDNYLGVVSLVCIKQGKLQKGEKIIFMHSGKHYVVERVGVFTPKREDRLNLLCGEVGWVACGLKEIKSASVGDTLTSFVGSASEALPGFVQIKPQVYAGLFPRASDEYEALRVALGKLSLNDASLVYEPEESAALGSGFRCGFLGLLHMEIVQARLEREAKLTLILTIPSVGYRITLHKGNVTMVSNPSKLPPLNTIRSIEEPIAHCHILVPQMYLGSVIALCTAKRGEQLEMTYHGQQVSLVYAMPMAEVVIDLFDQLKSVSRGYASLDYTAKGYAESDIVRLDILVNSERVDAFSLLVFRAHAAFRGRAMIEKLQTILARQQFDIALQASIGQHILARTTIRQYRKNVTGKCYGGDGTRKRKLLEKQKEGKKKMRKIGAVEIPQEAFFKLLTVVSKVQ